MSKKKKEYLQNNYVNYSYDGHNKGRILGIDFTKNPEQRELIRLMNDNATPVIYCFGNAGTGKTFTAVAAAIDLVKIQKKYNRVFYIREPLEVGKSLGFLPGDQDEKFSVFTGGLYDNLLSIHEFSGLNINDMSSVIECLPPQYTRGRSFSPGSILIIDEAQNLSLDSIQTLLTRVGKFSKVVLLGSFNQIDIKNKTKNNNDFLISYNILSEIVDENFKLGEVTLVKSERSEFCAIIDDAITKYKENKNRTN